MGHISFRLMLMTLIYWRKYTYCKKKTEAFLAAGKEIDLEVNAEKTEYMLMSHEQKGGQYHNIKISNKSID
jgi:hypothetical protein